ncbi:MAG: hypothetical protein JJ863_22665 [Deltaproteobacteria bacterium]|nr:hypothetical protein [Deltaproteobacteria bacterium]
MRTVLAAVFLLACAPKPSTGVAVTTMEPPPAGASGTLSNDPVRDELREILIPCQRTMNRVIEEGRMRRSRYQRIATALAVVLAQAAYYGANLQGGGNSASGQPFQADRCTGPTADRPECTSFGGAPAWGGGTIGADEDRLDEYIEVPTGQVQQAVHAIDDLLWSAPDSNDWTDEQYERWLDTRRELKRACRALERENEDS